MAIAVTADPIELSLSIYNTYSLWPPAPRDETLDQTLDIDPIIITVTSVGDWLNISHISDPIEIVVGMEGAFPVGVLVTSDEIEIAIGFGEAYTFTEASKNNWIKWSNIGSLDFTIGRDNIAGERPLDWRGWIWNIKKLGDKIVVYGDNGISILTPASNLFKLESINRTGIKSRGTVTGTDQVHFYIDSIDRLWQLWQLNNELELLDYSEYLSQLSDPIMTFDEKNSLVYICDGTLGFVFSLLDKSFGEGPVNLTGLGYQDKNLYIVSPATVENRLFELTTDIYDFGTRSFKSISSIEVGTDLSGVLEASVDFRVSKHDNFTSLDWFSVNPAGVAYIPCYGVEFRIKLRALIYEYFELDYLKINGQIHNYSYTKHGRMQE